MTVIVRLLIILYCSLVSAGLLDNNYLEIYDFNCQCSAPICVNASCAATKLEGSYYTASIRAFIAQAQSKVMVQLKTFQMTAKNQWKLTNFNINFDYCAFARGANNPILTTFAPGIREKLGNMLRPCPYRGQIELSNYTFNMARMSVRLPKGTKTKLEVNFVNSRKVTMFGVYSLSNVI